MFRKALSAASLALLSTAVSAANIPCHSCSEGVYESRAIGAGTGRHYVFDYPQGNLRRYLVECRSGINQRSSSGTNEALRAPAAAAACRPGSRLIAEPLENEPSMVQGFLDLKWFWDETGGTMRKGIEIDYPDLPGATPDVSAYDVIQDYNFRSRLSDGVADRAYELWRMSFVLSAANAFRGFTDGIRMSIVVKFADGTTSVFSLNYPDVNAKYEPESSRTPDGQAIPEANSPIYAGTWDTDMGTPEALQDFLDYLTSLGIPVIRTNGTTLRCTWDGHTLRCV